MITEPEIFQALTLAAALRLYDRCGLKANRHYTPSNMLGAASEITGQQFKRGQYTQAAAALDTWAEAALDTWAEAQLLDPTTA